MNATYCLKCKRITKSINPQITTTISGKYISKSMCIICKTLRVRFFKRMVGEGLDIQKAFSKLPGFPWSKYPGEHHLINYNF